MHSIVPVVMVGLVWFAKWGWMLAVGLVIKTPSDAATKWGTRASAAQSAYTTGVANTQKDQAALAAAAQPQWAASVAAAAAANRFATRITAAGTGAWKAGVAALGGARYSQGVTAPTAQAKYVKGVTPIFAALAGLQLPARNVKGSNSARIDAVVNAEMAAAKAAS
jgi:hypothetical protein